MAATTASATRLKGLFKLLNMTEQCYAINAGAYQILQNCSVSNKIVLLQDFNQKAKPFRHFTCKSKCVLVARSHQNLSYRIWRLNVSTYPLSKTSCLIDYYESKSRLKIYMLFSNYKKTFKARRELVTRFMNCIDAS